MQQVFRVKSILVCKFVIIESVTVYATFSEFDLATGNLCQGWDLGLKFLASRSVVDLTLSFPTFIFFHKKSTHESYYRGYIGKYSDYL